MAVYAGNMASILHAYVCIVYVQLTTRPVRFDNYSLPADN